MELGLLQLNNLLNQDEGNSSDDDQPSRNLGARLGPGSIGSKSKDSSKQKIGDVYGKFLRL